MVIGQAEGVPRTERSRPLPRHEAIDPLNTYCAVVLIQQFDSARVTLGYHAAERLMDEWASRVEEAIPAAVLGRVGRSSIELGFQAASGSDAEQLLGSALTMVGTPVEHAGMRLQFNGVAGFTPSPQHSFDDAAIDRATAAAALASHRTDGVCFQPAMTSAEANDDFRIAQALYAAIEFDELNAFYQPKLHCRKDKVGAVEALTRFSSEALSMVSIDRAFLVAERIGAIAPLTDWLAERVIADRHLLKDAGQAPVIDINLSGRLLSDRRYTERLAQRLAARGVGVEITETAVLTDPVEAIRNVNLLAEAGIPIAIDDYGSGFSSLAYLKELPANELKIDRTFIKGLTTSHRDPLLVRSTIDLAHALEMEVTAEGVDDALSLSLLRVMGCDQVQGYLIARPMDCASLQTWLADTTNFVGMGTSIIDLPQADIKEA